MFYSNQKSFLQKFRTQYIEPPLQEAYHIFMSAVSLPARNILQPALIRAKLQGKETLVILRIFGLVILKQHLIPQSAEDLDLSGHMGHRVAEGLGLSVAQGPGLCHDLIPSLQRDLELCQNALCGSALEYIIRQDADSRQRVEKLREDLRIVIYPLQENDLVADRAAGFDQRAYCSL